MTYRRARHPRRGMILAEAGFVYALTLLLVVGAIVIGLGVFRYHQIAWLAREGARWAAVHGPTYQSEQSASAPTSVTVMSNAVTPLTVALKSASLTGTLTWNTAATPPTVTFQLTYTWVPESYLSPVTFTSTSTQVIMY
jgi:hypothetical protein